jgi:hypothetical protein
MHTYFTEHIRAPMQQRGISPAGLAPKMARHGCALDEEAVAEALLSDLASA